MGFTYFLEQLTLWGLLLLSAAGLLWLTQRLSLLSANPSFSATRVSHFFGRQVSLHSQILLITFLPLFIFYTLLQRCGLLASSNWLALTTLRWGFFTQGVLIFFFLVLSPTRAHWVAPAAWPLEQLGVILFLSFAWVMFFFSHSFLTSLLWLEVTGLLALLLLGFFGYSSVSLGGLSGAWRLFFFNEAGGFGVAHALLTLLWVNGLAAVLLLLGWVLVCSTGLGLDFELLSLTAASAGRLGTPLGLYSFSFGVGFMLKVLLPPLQFFLLSVYRSLPLQAMVPYVLFYYSMFVPALFGCLLGPLGCLLSGWIFLWSAFVLVLYLTLMGGLASLGEFRFVLAFSSALNLSFMLIVLPALTLA